jgi:sterol desaturase/sphingolipid hydroxylase (fatty acid hydroxylase superfamily)
MQALALIFVVAAMFMAWERLFPGRELPRSPGWYLRAACLNATQLGMVVLGGYTWSQWLQGPSLFHIDGAVPAVLQGFICWFVGTFFFYWWHRARHSVYLFWRVFHQIHHSAARIETLTAFYKHPLEIAVNSVLSTVIIFPLLGASMEAAPWYSFFAALGEFYYHANLSTPKWTGCFMQRPEQHSIHHQLGVHDFNYGDITWWDRLFGTFKEAERFAPQCGYHGAREQFIACMLMFEDVNKYTANEVQSAGRERPALD